MTVDAKALYEIVRDVPRAVWPDGLHYEPGEEGVPLWVLDLDGLKIEDEEGEEWKPPASIIPPQHAELMFEALIMWWLCAQRMLSVRVIQMAGDDGVYWRVEAISRGEKSWFAHGKSLLDALVIVCSCVQKDVS